MHAKELLDQLNNTDEHSRLEAKLGSQIGDSILETICAFSNEPGLGGGYLLLGVREITDTLFEPIYEPVDLGDVDKLQTELTTQCATAFNIPIRPQIELDTIPLKNSRSKANVIVVKINEVDANQKPVFIKKYKLPLGAFRRIGSSDIKCTEEDVLVLYQNRKSDSYDESLIDGASLDDISTEELDYYRELRKNEKEFADDLSYSDNDLLLAIGCAKFKEGKLVPTVAGLLLFGTKLTLRRFFPMMRIDYLRVEGNEWIKDPDKRFDTIEIRDPLIRAFSRVSAAILDDIPKAFSLEDKGMQRKEISSIPSKVVRELVVNAIMHRDYRVQSPITVIRYSNRLEVRNPGYSLKSEDAFLQPGSETRNPKIAAVMHELGFAETKGSGLRTMKKLMQGAGLSAPNFESDRGKNQFVAYLLMHHFMSEDTLNWLANFKAYNITDEEAKALFFVREVGAINVSAYKFINEVSGTDASIHLRRLRDLNLLVKKGKRSSAFYLPTALLLAPQRSPIGSKPSQDIGDSEIEELPKDLKIEVTALGKKTQKKRMWSVILKLCEWKELTPNEIAYYVSRNQDHIRMTYLTKLLDEDLLTISTNPSNPHLTYEITPKGIRWLSENQKTNR
ncbi:MAG: putative DNA binding domain-containing protein [bacterium]|nr:putative DNA binding domain-containing protein [bacterium]